MRFSAEAHVNRCNVARISEVENLLKSGDDIAIQEDLIGRR